jgi:hypothetical protein
VLGHSKTLLTAMRHLIPAEGSALQHITRL